VSWTTRRAGWRRRGLTEWMTRWREAVCTATFYDRDEGAATVDDVLEVLQLEEGKVRCEPMGRKRERGTGLTAGGRSGGGGSTA
jgi:hypothetical protein